MIKEVADQFPLYSTIDKSYSTKRKISANNQWLYLGFLILGALGILLWMFVLYLNVNHSLPKILVQSVPWIHSVSLENLHAFPKNQETPSRADSVMTQFPWSNGCFFCSKIWLFDWWALMAGRLAVILICVVFVVCFVELQCRLGLLGLGCWKAECCKAKNNLEVKFISTLCKSVVFPWSLFDSIVPTLLNII